MEGDKENSDGRMRDVQKGVRAIQEKMYGDGPGDLDALAEDDPLKREGL